MTFISAVFKNSKVIYTGLGIVLGLALSYTAYSFIKTNELKSEVEKQKVEIESLRQHTDSITKALISLKEDQINKAITQDELNKTVVVNKEEEKIKSSHDTNWQNAINENSFVTFIEYLSTNDNEGHNKTEVVSKLLDLGTTGWLYVGRTSNKKEFSRDQIVEVIWRPNSNNGLTRALPQVGDVVNLVSPSARRTYSNFAPRNSPNGLWQKESKAYVYEMKMEGPTAVMIKIIYN